MNFTDINILEKELEKCDKCNLRLSAIAPTSYNGAKESPFMIVGEGPGVVEDEYGTPLVGPSGKLLDKALNSVGITRDRIYVTNVIKCRPKNNRTPTIEEGDFCAKIWLDKEIEIVKPKIIVALGSVALKYLYSPNGRITKDRGIFLENKYGCYLIATYHPAYLLRLFGKDLVKAKWEVFYDLKNAVEKCAKLAPDFSLKSDAAPDLLAIYDEQKKKRSLFKRA